MAALQTLVDRSGDLKRDLVSFAEGTQFRRLLDQAFSARFGTRPRTIDESEYTNFLDHFILQRRLPDGRTVLGCFIEAHPELPAAERDMLLGWRDVVEGVFEVERREGAALVAVNLLDDLAYRIRSNVGPGILKKMPPGSFLIARLVPVGGEWLLSGLSYTYPASDAADAARLAIDLGNRNPALIFRNPRKLEEARTLQRQECAAFRTFFGSDVVVVPGREVEARMNAYWHFRTVGFRDSTGQTAAQRAKEQYGAVPELREPPLPHRLTRAKAVGVICDEMEGLHYFPEFALLEETFARPELAADRQRRQIVLTYLRDADTTPLPLRRLAERDPARASRVFQEVLRQPRFSWQRDGEALLRQHKPDFFDRPVFPSVLPIGERLQSLCSAASRVTVSRDADQSTPRPAATPEAPEASEERVPRAVRPRFDAIVGLTDALCARHLTAEYAPLCRRLAAALARKRPSPLLQGKAESWACGIVYAIGSVNLLFDKTQTPHLRADELCRLCGVSPATGSAKARFVRDTFGMFPLDPRWCLPSKLAENPLAWMVEVNGVIVDVRDAPSR